MKTTILALGLALGATGSASCAQQGSMPQMPMPPQTTQPTQPTTHAQPGEPNRNDQPAATMPPNMQSMGHDAGNRRAQTNASAERDSVQQQSGQANKRPGAASDQMSTQFPMQEVQEPEAIELHTGADLPAPELLGQVVQREPMTLEQFLALAEKNNPTLAQAQNNIDRSNQQARQISLPPNPVLGYSGDHIRGGSYHSGEEGVFFTQEFVLGHKLALRRNVYRAEAHTNELALEVQRARVHNDVARAFFDTLAAQQSVVLHDRLLKVALDSETNAHELLRIGQMDAAAVLTAEVAAEQAGIDFVTAQRLFLSRFADLATSAGQRSLDTHPLRGSLAEPPAFDSDEYVRTGMSESPLVKQAEANELLEGARLKDATRERVPDLSLTAGEWYSGEGLNNGQKAGWESFAQAGVQVPLWNRNQGNIAAAKALVERAHGDVERTKLWTRNQTEPLAQRYETARFAAERYRTEMLPRARRAYELQVIKYQQMSAAYAPVLVAQQLLFTLQLAYTTALNEEWKAAIALQNYALANSLEQPSAAGSDATTLNLPTAYGSER